MAQARLLVGAAVAVALLTRGVLSQSTSSQYNPFSNQWSLVFRHVSNSGGNIQYWPRNQWRVNPTQPSNRLYSVMDALEQYRQPDGSFVMMMRWPGICSRYAGRCTNRGGTQVNWVMWKQTSDPYRTAPDTVNGYVPIDVDNRYNTQRPAAPFGGLTATSGTITLMDAQPTHQNWHFAVGSYTQWGGTGLFPAMPAFRGVASVEILVWGAPRYSVSSPLWRLVFRQSAASGFRGWPNGPASSANHTGSDMAPVGSGSPGSAALFSQLSLVDTIDQAHTAAGNNEPLAFKVVYPSMCSRSTCDAGRDYVIFTQPTNPLSTAASGSPTLVDVGSYTGAGSSAQPAFGGLQPSSGTGAAVGARVSNSPSSGAYQIGVASAPSGCSNCLPGPMSSGGQTMYTPTVELYAYTNVVLPSGSCDLNSNYYVYTNGGAAVQCMALTTCTLGQTYQSRASTRFSDRACSPVTQCGSGTYTQIPATLNDDAQCAPLSPDCATYAVPHYEIAVATSSSDRVCAVQPACNPPFTYRSVAPTATTAAVCRATTDCGDDRIQQAAPTLSTDRVCASCPAGQYVVNGQCQNAAQCQSGSQFQTVPAVGDDNTVCASVTQCSSTWQYRFAPATSSSDTVCVALTNCTGASTVATTGTSTSAATCGPRCTPCGAGAAVQPSSTPGECPTCAPLTPPAIGVSNPVAVSSDASTGSLNLRAAAVRVHGVDLVGWVRALQSKVEASESAAVAQAAEADATRTRLEAQVGRLTSDVAQLKATVSALVAMATDNY